MAFGNAAEMREQADTLAEEALQIADAMADTTADPITREQIAVAKERIDVRKWLATVNNPDRYQPKQANQAINININALHLDALKKQRDVTPPHTAPQTIGRADE